MIAGFIAPQVGIFTIFIILAGWDIGNGERWSDLLLFGQGYIVFAIVAALLLTCLMWMTAVPLSMMLERFGWNSFAVNMLLGIPAVLYVTCLIFDPTFENRTYLLCPVSVTMFCYYLIAHTDKILQDIQIRNWVSD